MERARLALSVLLPVAVGCANLSGLTGGDAGLDGDHAVTEHPDSRSSSGSSSRSGSGSSSSSSGSSAGTSKGSGPIDASTHTDGGDAASGACTIGGLMHSAGAADPSDSCKSCQPATNPSDWSPDVDGTGCGDHAICVSGVCNGNSCEIDGVNYASGQNPNDPCQTCDPGSSTSAWSSIPDGTGCGNDQTCLQGICGTNCTIGDGGVFPSGMLNPANACQLCQPGMTTTAWSSVATGTTCGASEICHDSTCGAGCYINATFFGQSVHDPAHGCLVCVPATSTSTWTAEATGTACSAGSGTSGMCDSNGDCSPGTGTGTGSSSGCGTGSATGVGSGSAT